MYNATPKYYYFITAVVVLLFLVFLNTGGHLQKARDWTGAFLMPVEEIIHSAGKNVYDFFRAFIMVWDIKEENIELKTKNRELVNKLVDFEGMKVENELLKSHLENENIKDYEFAMADIVGSNPQNDKLYLLINKGKEDGIDVGMPVVISGNCLVGKIVEANSKYSKVLLINDGSSKLNGITNDGRVSGVVEGGHGYYLLMDMVSQDSKLQEEEIVITSGMDGQFPKGLVIGTIKEIKKFDNQIFQQAMLKPFFEINELEKLFVITNLL